jgi:2',3'-cyclic-nucleotide 2'-phosphodiesterase (5'-nucleotidase family)
MLIKLAQQYPEITLFLGGHTHVNIPGEKIGSNGWYVQAGKHAQGVAKINITFNPNSRKVDRISSSIIPVTDSTICDKQCLAAISHELKEVMRLSKQPIGITTHEISATTKPGMLSSAAELNGLAMAASAKTKIAFSSANYRANILPGKINRQQAFSLYPYQDTVCTLRLTATETKNIIEEQLKLSSQYHWPLAVGLKTELYANGNFVKNLYFSDGTVWVDNGQRITIAFSSYDLAGIYGRKFLLLHKLSLTPECQGKNSGIKIYQAVADYIQLNSPVKLINNVPK